MYCWLLADPLHKARCLQQSELKLQAKLNSRELAICQLWGRGGTHGDLVCSPFSPWLLGLVEQTTLAWGALEHLLSPEVVWEEEFLCLASGQIAAGNYACVCVYAITIIVGITVARVGLIP